MDGTRRRTPRRGTGMTILPAAYLPSVEYFWHLA